MRASVIIEQVVLQNTFANGPCFGESLLFYRAFVGIELKDSNKIGNFYILQ